MPYVHVLCNHGCQQVVVLKCCKWGPNKLVIGILFKDVIWRHLECSLKRIALKHALSCSVMLYASNTSKSLKVSRQEPRVIT